MKKRTYKYTRKSKTSVTNTGQTLGNCEANDSVEVKIQKMQQFIVNNKISILNLANLNDIEIQVINEFINEDDVEVSYKIFSKAINRVEIIHIEQLLNNFRYKIELELNENVNSPSSSVDLVELAKLYTLEYIIRAKVELMKQFDTLYDFVVFNDDFFATKLEHYFRKNNKSFKDLSIKDLEIFYYDDDINQLYSLTRIKILEILLNGYVKISNKPRTEEVDKVLNMLKDNELILDLIQDDTKEKELKLKDISYEKN